MVGGLVPGWSPDRNNLSLRCFIFIFSGWQTKGQGRGELVDERESIRDYIGELRLGTNIGSCNTILCCWNITDQVAPEWLAMLLIISIRQYLLFHISARHHSPGASYGVTELRPRGYTSASA